MPIFIENYARTNMNLQEAKGLLNKLSAYKGQVMQPFNYPVKDLLILPAGQKELDQMLKDLSAKRCSLDTALAPYSDNVKLIVYFDYPQSDDVMKHCDAEYFMKINGLNMA